MGQTALHYNTSSLIWFVCGCHILIHFLLCLSLPFPFVYIKLSRSYPVFLVVPPLSPFFLSLLYAKWLAQSSLCSRWVIFKMKFYVENKKFKYLYISMYIYVNYVYWWLGLLLHGVAMVKMPIQICVHWRVAVVMTNTHFGLMVQEYSSSNSSRK